jgi:2-phospho-L-lactate/phosphoenolpyruvate guanylyltransferase
VLYSRKTICGISWRVSSALLPVVFAIVPMKELDRAKSRLATRLNGLERRSLALEMFTHVVRTLKQQAVIAEVLVVSRDLDILQVAVHLGARPLFDEASDLNGALEQARSVAREAGAGALLVAHGDLPLLAEADVLTMVQALADGNDLVLAPDAAEQGTNAMGVMIDAPFAFQFEGQSFPRHLAAAAWNELLVSVVRSPTLALDVDTPLSLTKLAGLSAEF